MTSATGTDDPPPPSRPSSADECGTSPAITNEQDGSHGETVAIASNDNSSNDGDGSHLADTSSSNEVYTVGSIQLQRSRSIEVAPDHPSCCTWKAECTDHGVAEWRSKTNDGNSDARTWIVCAKCQDSIIKPNGCDRDGADSPNDAPSDMNVVADTTDPSGDSKDDAAKNEEANVSQQDEKQTAAPSDVTAPTEAQGKEQTDADAAPTLLSDSSEDDGENNNSNNGTAQCHQAVGDSSSKGSFSDGDENPKNVAAEADSHPTIKEGAAENKQDAGVNDKNDQTQPPDGIVKEDEAATTATNDASANMRDESSEKSSVVAPAGTDANADAPVTANSYAIADVDVDADAAEEGSGWDLQKIFSISVLSSTDGARLCDQCSMPAFGIYVDSSNKADRWAYCIDCQENDFGGWPSVSDIPVDYLSAEHKKLIRKCSKKRNPKMPNLPEAPPESPQTSPAAAVSTVEDDMPKHNVLLSTAGMLSPVRTPPKGNGDAGPIDASMCVTPPPSNVCVGMVHMPGGAKASGNLAKPRAVTPLPKAPPPQPSKASLAIHKKWQDAATAMGGGRIVVSKPSAKQLILDTLFGAMKPMNITQMHKALKGVVPAPLLSSCLKEMALQDDSANPFDDDSDDDGCDGDSHSDKAGKKKGKKSKTSSAGSEFGGTVVYKPGRSMNASLYYFDHTKKASLSISEQQENAEKLAKVTAQKAAMEMELQASLKLTKQLLSEPTNVDLEMQLESEQAAVSKYTLEVADARELEVNQAHRLKTKRKIAKMATSWRVRKRQCMEFINRLEEMTDGTISSRKCFSGDGQITLDSDKGIRDGALRFEKDKRDRMKRMSAGSGSKRSGMGKVAKMRSLSPTRIGAATSSAGKASDARSDLVAVMLGSGSTIERVYFDDAELKE